MVYFLKKTLFSRRAWFWHAASHIMLVEYNAPLEYVRNPNSLEILANKHVKTFWDFISNIALRFLN